MVMQNMILIGVNIKYEIFQHLVGQHVSFLNNRLGIKMASKTLNRNWEFFDFRPLFFSGN
jgi:hypothetical protein